MEAPDGRIPLHPTVISDDAASLLPGTVRGAFVGDFELDGDANVTAVTVTRACIRSIRQCDYPGVQAEADSSTATEAMELLRQVGEKHILLERQRGGASLNRADQEGHRGRSRLPRREVPSGRVRATPVMADISTGTVRFSV